MGNPISLYWMNHYVNQEWKDKYLRYFGLDILWFLHSKQRFSSIPSWFKLFSKDTFYQDGSLDDIKPFVYGTFGGILKQLNPSFRKKKSGLRN